MRILLVEDEPAAAAVLLKGLREQSYATDLAPTGEAALYLTAITDYDGIVLDVLLPGINGFQVCRTLRKRGATIPVLLLTARDAVEDRIEGLNSGGDDYLVKPFAFEELLARLRAVLRRRQMPPRPDLFEAAGLRFDIVAHQVWRGDRVLALTSREYALLTYLVQHIGVVKSRADITEAVWNEYYLPKSNVIDVFVQRLRRKIDVPGKESLIHTVPQEGYEFRAG